MRVLGVRRNSEPHPAVDGVFAMTRLEDALREADFVVLTVALSEQTRFLIDASALSAMKRSAYVINVSRGEVVRSEEHTSELQSRGHLVCRLLLEKKKRKIRREIKSATERQKDTPEIL